MAASRQSAARVFPLLALLALLALVCSLGCSKSQPSIEKYPYHVFRGKGKPARLAVSADQKWLAWCSEDPDIQIVSLSDHKDTYRLQGTAERLQHTRLAFSPDGRYLLSGGINDKFEDFLVVWNLQRRAPEKALPIREGINGLAVSSDGALAAVARADGKIELFTLPSLDSRGVLPGHNGLFGGIAFLPGSKRLVTSGVNDGFVSLWNTETMNMVASKQLKSNGTYVGSLAVDAASAHIAVARGESLDAKGPADTGILVLDATNLETQQLIKANQGRDLAFTLDGKGIVWGVTLYDLENGKKRAFFAAAKQDTTSLIVNGLPPSATSIAFFDNGDGFVYGDEAGNVLFFNVKD